MDTFERYESNVRSYSRNYPSVFERAKGSLIYDHAGKAYIDFLAGAGALNYGHNNDDIKKHIIDFLQQDRILHGLDLHTVAKETFIDTFAARILEPKRLNYKMQFCGPTGTNAVEAAVKLARKVTGRTNIFAFMGAFHGMTLGSLSLTGSKAARAGAGLPLGNVTFMPYPSPKNMGDMDTIAYIEAVLSDSHSGIDKPAAMILETIQGEGGVHVAPPEWLRRLRELCDEHEIILIVDDVQVGCGRCGDFFSFEQSGIVPDMVVLAKSISGYGLPMSLLLLKRELDIWSPGEHNGTFRGNQLAFVGGTAAIHYRERVNLKERVRDNGTYIANYLKEHISDKYPEVAVRGRGMIWGVDLSSIEEDGIAGRIMKTCFDNGLIIESAGRNDTVLKLLPPLTTERQILKQGLSILTEAVGRAI